MVYDEEITLKNGATLVLKPASYENSVMLYEATNNILRKTLQQVRGMFPNTDIEKMNEEEQLDLMLNVQTSLEDTVLLRKLTLKCLENSLYKGGLKGQDFKEGVQINATFFDDFIETRVVHGEILEKAQEYNNRFFLKPQISQSKKL